MSDCISDVCSSDLSGSEYWNITAGDFAHASGWIGAGTGLLAIDLNEDGIINDHSELFGTQTTDGFTILAGYDSDTDNDIDSSDAAWDDMLIWTDDNSDGYSQARALLNLDEQIGRASCRARECQYV